MLIATIFKPGEEDKQEIVFDGLLLTDQHKIKLEAELQTHRVLAKTFPGEFACFSINCTDDSSCISFSENISSKLGLPAKIEANGPPTCAYAELCIHLLEMLKI